MIDPIRKLYTVGNMVKIKMYIPFINMGILPDVLFLLEDILCFL